ncbi:type 1 fimbrial protein [Dyella koreensis]|uniref:Type 1 fimbrial protein n=1 Tax=Dyella koreensis TaxID=311235 RepID=A0ABW8JZI5_9GAMM
MKFVLSCSACGGVFPFKYDNNSWINQNLAFGAGSRALYIKVIKIGPVVEGGNISGTIAKVAQADFGDLILWNANSPIIIQPDIPTCTIIAGDVNKSVTLQRVKSSDFNNSPGTGDVPFTLTAANCQNATSATFTFSGTPDSTNPVLFKSTGDAAGVGVRIYPASDSSQTIGANGTNNAQTVTVSGGQAVLSLGAQYYKTGATVGAGQVTTRATVTMSYN